MLEHIKVRLDKFLLDHFWRLSFLPYELRWKYDFPTKRLVTYCLESYLDLTGGRISSKSSQIAHMYAYDSTCDADNLEFMHDLHNTNNRERVRQILCKFVRQNYRR